MKERKNEYDIVVSHEVMVTFCGSTVYMCGHGEHRNMCSTHVPCVLKVPLPNSSHFMYMHHTCTCILNNLNFLHVNGIS